MEDILIYFITHQPKKSRLTRVGFYNESHVFIRFRINFILLKKHHGYTTSRRDTLLQMEVLSHL